MDSYEIYTENYSSSSDLKPELPTNESKSGTNNQKKKDNDSSANDYKHKPKKNSQNDISSTQFITSWGRWKIFLGILFIISAAYLLLVSISFFAHGAEDQSIVQGKDYANIVANGDKISNTGGPMGAFMSNLLLSRWLGLGSFILIFYIGVLGLYLVSSKKFKFWSLTYKCLLSAIAVSVLIGFVTFTYTSHNFWGGDHGYAINKYLIDNTGYIGAIGVSIILLASVILVFLNQIQSSIAKSRRRMEQYKAKIAKEKAAIEARRQRRKNLHNPDILIQPDDNPKLELQNISPKIDEGVVSSSSTKNDIKTETYHPGNIGGQSAPEIHQKENDKDFQNAGDFEKANHQIQQSPFSSTSYPQNPHNSNYLEKGNSAESLIPTTPAITDSLDKEIPQHPPITPEIPLASGKEDAEPFCDTYDPTLELSRYRFPSLDLLEDKVPRTDHVDLMEQEENKARLTETLRTFGVKISHIEATVGPTITRYEIIPAEGVRTRSVKSLGEDLALSLQALGVRIIAPIPGKGTIGIEVPNRDPQTVYIRNILASDTFRNFKGELPIALGTTITNDVYVADLAKLPHLLVAGATGMGKSVGLNTIITSLLYKKHPAELKFVLVDPKRVELSLYRSLERHYLASLPGEDSIITDMSKVVTVLNSLCKEMEDRLALLQAAEVRNIKEYNAKFVAKKLNPLKHRYLPYIVLIIDEFADIILTQGKEVENPVSRLAAVARAAGIHLIIATQRPSVNVITGGIKTNIPGRMAFRVNQGVDSRTIIDQVGANLLNGKGDMLFSRDGIIDRVQGGFISTEEVKSVVDFIGDQIGYDEAYQLPEFIDTNAEGGIAKGGALTDRDPMFEDAGRLVVNSNSGSTTMLQRKLSIGFGRAARIMDQLEIAGVVGPAQGGKPRDVLMDMYAFERYLNPPPSE